MKIKKIINVIKHPQKIIIHLASQGLIKYDDQKYLEYVFKERLHTPLDVENPQTFNAKLQYLKLHDHNPQYTMMVDKYQAKEYFAKTIGQEYVIPLINNKKGGVYNSVKEIDFNDLPSRFVLKTTHDSGTVVVCSNKNNFDSKKALKFLKKRLKRKYFYLYREWPYKNVKPRIIAEEYMEDKLNQELIDYKIMCFNGQPKMIFTCTDRFSKEGLKVTFFDLDWHKLDFTRHYPSSSKPIAKPKNLAKMLEIATKLAQDIPFVRVDFYEINGKLYIGELTFYPGSGLEEFNPESWDLKVGELLNLKENQNE